MGRVLKSIVTGWLSCLLPIAAMGQASPNDVARLAASYNAMGFRLLAKTRPANPDKNIFLSPAGVGFALSMAANGADGRTLSEIRSTLQVGDQTNLNQGNDALIHALTGSDAVKVEIANSLWSAATVPLRKPFIDLNQNFYHAQVASVDFKNPLTAGQINLWCSQQ